MHIACELGVNHFAFKLFTTDVMDTMEATVTATKADNGAAIFCSRGDFSSTTNEKRQAYMHIKCGILASD